MESLNDSADVFANSSAETVTENSAFRKEEAVPSPMLENSEEFEAMHTWRSPLWTSSPYPEENSSLLSDRLVSEVCHPPPERLYCPFCPLDYGFEFLLRDHIRGVHSYEVRAVAKALPGCATFQACPFCHAKFYVKELLPKHILKKHDAGLGADMGGGDYLECMFCPHRVLRRHKKLLAVHIEKKHFTEFERRVLENPGKMPSREDLASWCLDGELRVTTQVTEGPVRSLLIRPILKTPTRKEDPKDEEVPLEGMNARRRLRFDLPDSPEDRLSAVFGQKKKNKKKTISKWKSLLKSKKKNKENTPPSSTIATSPKKNSPLPGSVLRFRCGLCKEAFEKNCQLVEHLAKGHRAPSFHLSARYTCGECHAKFYRNSFLVRHCSRHHTPLCLKTKQMNIH
ncbi:hypothetical protein AAG570_004515 [Ranatra chinensis]|uniref:C2H2-type domain-containing protein n=1 Tax=Ranatra chinensis TaxID=642074 RepID=A0ABD0Y1D9_9HEMI